MQNINSKDIRLILEKGILAPSGDNWQPWRFHINEEMTVDLHLHCHPLLPFFEYNNHGRYLSAGAVIENMRLAAIHLGYQLSVSLFPNNSDLFWVARMSFSPLQNNATTQTQSHYLAIADRATNRRLYDTKQPIDANLYSDLELLTNPVENISLAWLKQEDPHYDKIATLIAKAGRMCFEHHQSHDEFFEGLRFKKNLVRSQRDGLDIDTLETGPLERLVLKFGASWTRQKLLNYLGAGYVAQAYTKSQVMSSKGIGFLFASNNNPEAFVIGGQIMQRIWLELTSRHISLQPMQALPIFLNNLSHLEQAPMKNTLVRDLQKMNEEFYQLFQISKESGLVFLFRIGFAKHPTARSIRRPIESFII